MKMKQTVFPGCGRPNGRLVLAIFCVLGAACGGGSGSTPPADTTTDGTADSAPPAPTCDATRRPIVFAHGFLAAGDTFANHAMRFEANGYCLDRIVAFDWNTLDQDYDHAADLDAIIAAVLADTGADRVDLAGHSAGGGLGYTYLGTSEYAAKVAHYAHIGSYGQTGPAGATGEVATLNLWSEGDLIIETKGDIPGATNVKLTDADHYSVATSAESFDAIYRFFNDGEAPSTTAIQPHPARTLAGKVLTLGENLRGVGVTVDIYACDSGTGFRQNDTPIESLVTDQEGHWGPFDAAEGVAYEFHIHSDKADDRPIHYYFEPFERSNPFVYLRTLPGPGSLAGMLMSSLPQPEDATTLVVFSASAAMFAGTDSLTNNGFELLTADSAKPEDTLLALFLYDVNENGETDGEPAALFSVLPFLNGLDVHIPSGDPESVPLVFNGRALNIRNWSTALDGPVIAVFR